MMPKIDFTFQNAPGKRLETLKKNSASAKDDQALKDACAGFESIFLKKTMESMRNTLEGDALFGKSNAMSIYESMYDQYLSEHLSRSEKTMGLKDFLYNQLKKDK